MAYWWGSHVGTAPFGIKINYGAAWSLPNCVPECLISNEADANVKETIVKRIYKEGAVCYEAQTRCSGTCITSPATTPDDMQPLSSCPLRVCNTTLDTLSHVSGSSAIELFLDVSEMKYDLDLTSIISNPNTLTLTSRVSNSTTADAYSALNTSFTGLFTTNGAIVSFN